jgi:PIN domain nuclease of toxin-antitoxin system
VSDRLLLDTNVILRVLTADKKMSARARRALDRPGTSLVVSIVSVWEIVLKHQTGKLTLRDSLSQVLEQVLYRSSWIILTMGPEHLLALASLPMLHSDPFDRLLIAQAKYENLTIVTADEQIREYAIKTLW